MSDQNTTNTDTSIVRERIETNSGGSGLAFIVGGLVVAVLVLAWLFTGGDFGFGGGDDTTISIEVPAALVPAAPAPAAN